MVDGTALYSGQRTKRQTAVYSGKRGAHRCNIIQETLLVSSLLNHYVPGI